MTKKKNTHQQEFITWFRSTSPYVNAHRGRTFVIAFAGEAVQDEHFADLVHDIASLNSLGIRLVLVHGARPQIEQRLRMKKAEIVYNQGLRITDDAALECVKEAAGCVRVEIEALLSMGLANTPMSGARIHVASGNFVISRPLGIRDGIDYLHTGEVRRIDTGAVTKRLDNGDIVLLSPIGYSPTGEIFNLSAEDVATAAAIELQADKLLFLLEGEGVADSRRRLIQELTPAGAEKMLESRRNLSDEIRSHLQSAAHACRFGVRRAHLIPRKIDGALLHELFTRDGIGTLISADSYETMRKATIEDVGGIIELLKPLEEEGILVKRSRELLEMEIDYYMVFERDGMIIACAALYPYMEEKVGELACMAVHPDYRNGGRGDRLIQQMEKLARGLQLDKLFLLTTRTSHWFRERGYLLSDIKQLPVRRRQLYNYQRNSKIFVKNL